MKNKIKHITGEKEYLYEKCKECVHAYFDVAQGLHPDYGWWIQICKYPKEDECVPTKKIEQLKLFDI